MYMYIHCTCTLLSLSLSPILYIPCSTHQVDTTPAAGLGDLLEVVVGYIQCYHSPEVIECIRQGPQTIMREIQLLQLVTAPLHIVRNTWRGREKSHSPLEVACTFIIEVIFALLGLHVYVFPLHLCT